MTIATKGNSGWNKAESYDWQSWLDNSHETSVRKSFFACFTARTQEDEKELWRRGRRREGLPLSVPMCTVSLCASMVIPFIPFSSRL